MSLLENSLWELTLGTPWIDPVELAAALERQAAEDDLDFRTRLLIRDSLNALLEHWGRPRLEKWLTASKRRGSLEGIWRSDLGPPGFPTYPTPHDQYQSG